MSDTPEATPALNPAAGADPGSLDTAAELIRQRREAPETPPADRDEGGRFVAKEQESAEDDGDDLLAPPAAEDEEIEPAEAADDDDVDAIEADDDNQPDTESDDEPQDVDDGAIEAPTSWTAEEKAAFAKLPPETQSALARRESERETYLQTRTQELAAQRAQTEQWSQGVYQTVAERVSTLDGVLGALQQAGVAQPDPALAHTDPAAYDAQMSLYSRVTDAMQQAGAQRQQMEQQAAHQRQAADQQNLAHQEIMLVQALPEMKDGVKAEAEFKDMDDYLIRAGFGMDDIKGMNDHRMFVTAIKAARYDKMMQKRKAVKAEKPKAPRVIKPSAQREPARPKGQQRERQAFKRLQSSGSLDDAAAAIKLRRNR